ncbi:hypothetical protein B0H13DRAFT_2315881 [Mycena leptocephala]|nr:hypothetical protein B0H13DRAFT_2315881 [Mycena leptocephala]
MTSEEFSQWITGASKSMQDSIITDLSWWAQRDTVLHHQFLLLRFEHLEPGGSTQFYELRLERAGKSLAGRAIDTMTISIPPPMVAPEFFKRYKLLFALLTHPEIVAPPCHSSGSSRVDTYYMEVAHGPRALPTLWENEHQIFAEKRQDYEESWRLLSL